MEQRVRRKFTPEFKARTVELVRSSGRPVAQVCRELDLTETKVSDAGCRAEVSPYTPLGR